MAILAAAFQGANASLTGAIMTCWARPTALWTGHLRVNTRHTEQAALVNFAPTPQHSVRYTAPQAGIRSCTQHQRSPDCYVRSLLFASLICVTDLQSLQTRLLVPSDSSTHSINH